jgi:hypothetical protein
MLVEEDFKSLNLATDVLPIDLYFKRSLIIESILSQPDLSGESCTCMYINIDVNNNEILNDFM